MREHEFAVVVEDAGDGWFWARSPEVPGANGQGRTPEEAVEDLVAAIELIAEVPGEVGDRACAPRSA